MPRWVMSSPSHISSVQPAVRQITISITFGKVSVPTHVWRPIRCRSERKRKT